MGSSYCSGALAAGLAAVLACAPIHALAQPAPAACSAMDSALPQPLAAWTVKTGLASATAASGLPGATIKLGQAARVALHGEGDVAFPLRPEKPGDPAAHGGLLQFSVDQPGAYRVALSSKAWIDVVREGRAVAFSAHGHGPECSTIRKIVDFPLQPGTYVLQISGDAEPEIGVLVTKAP